MKEQIKELERKRPALFTTTEHLGEPIKVGNIKENGFCVLEWNKGSKNSAFGVSADGRSFVLADGVDGYKNSGYLARELAKRIVTYNDGKENMLGMNPRIFLLEILQSIQQDPLFIKGKGKEEGSLEDDGATNLAFLYDFGPNWFYFLVGDSKLYVEHKDGSYQSFGMDPTFVPKLPPYLILKKDDIHFNVTKKVNQLDVFSGYIKKEPGLRLNLSGRWFPANIEYRSKDFLLKEAQRHRGKIKMAKKDLSLIPLSLSHLPLAPRQREYEVQQNRLAINYEDKAASADPFEPMILGSVRSSEEFRLAIESYTKSKGEIRTGDVNLIMIDSDRHRSFYGRGV